MQIWELQMRRTHDICLSDAGFILLICCLHFSANNMTFFPLAPESNATVQLYCISNSTSSVSVPWLNLAWFHSTAVVNTDVQATLQHADLEAFGKHSGVVTVYSMALQVMQRGWQWAQKPQRVSCKGCLSLHATDGKNNSTSAFFEKYKVTLGSLRVYCGQGRPSPPGFSACASPCQGCGWYHTCFRVFGSGLFSRPHLSLNRLQSL